MKENNEVYLCQNRHKDERRKSVTPSVQIYNRSTTRQEETLYNICFYLQTTNLIVIKTKSLRTKTYYHQLRMYRRFTAKEMNLCTSTPTYARTPTTIQCLSPYLSSRLSRKLVKPVKSFKYVPETTYHKPSLGIMLIIREPHFQLTLISINFKGFLQLLSVTISPYHKHILPYIHNRGPNFHLQLTYLK